MGTGLFGRLLTPPTLVLVLWRTTSAHSMPMVIWLLTDVSKLPRATLPFCTTSVITKSGLTSAPPPTLMLRPSPTIWLLHIVMISSPEHLTHPLPIIIDMGNAGTEGRHSLFLVVSLPSKQIYQDLPMPRGLS